MAHDFDTLPDFRNAHAQAWDNWQNVYRDGTLPEGDDVIPMWVADMDYAAAPQIRRVLATEAERGYYGYFGNPAPVTEAVTGWLSRVHGWEVAPDCIRYTNGVVAGIAITLEAFSEPGDGIILFPPVYHAFARKIRAAGREIVDSPLVLEDGVFRMDLDALQANLTGKEKAVIFCSPHNPGGRLWEAEEIRDLAAFCARNDLVLVSDEIHMDLTFPGQKHWPTAVAAPECLDRLVVLTAASKGFNIAGGEAAVAIIPDPKMKARFDRANAHVGGSINRFGMQMLKTAFAECGDWSEAVRAYLAENFVLWRDRVSAIPGITVMDMPSTYLTWVDFSGTGMSPAEIDQRVGHQARLAASPGTDFGTGGELCKRFNIAKPRYLLVEAIERLEAAFSDLQ